MKPTPAQQRRMAAAKKTWDEEGFKKTEDLETDEEQDEKERQ